MGRVRSQVGGASRGRFDQAWRLVALALALGIALLVGPSTLARSTAPRSPQLSFYDTSWFDSQHGWKAGVQGVVSTENGGRSWHRIGGSFEVMGLARISRRSGVVTEPCHGTGFCPTYWTRDNGRHWYDASSPLIGGGYRGSGKFLFWLGSRALFQVRPWPPRGRAPRRCGRRRECGPPAFDGGARAGKVADISAGEFAELANVPGGAMAVVKPDDPTMAVRILFRRAGRNSTSTLPVVPGIGLCEGFGSDPAVAWPKIVIFGCIGPNREATWVSGDGGSSWRVYGRRTARNAASASPGSVRAVGPTNWADSTHGWTAGYDRRANVALVLSTENGGRTWHRVGSVGPGFAVGDVLRTSVTAGVILVTPGKGAEWWWTRDNGRHWFLAPERLISNGEFQGSGQFLFWLSEHLTTIFQVRPWPPRGAAPRRCRRPGNCYLPVSAKARAVGVARISDGFFTSLTNIPGGILAVVGSRPPSSRARVFLRQSGRNQIIELPRVTGVRMCHSLGQEPVVTWPKIVVFGCAGIPPSATTAWVSEDGGKVWQVYRR